VFWRACASSCLGLCILTFCLFLFGRNNATTSARRGKKMLARASARRHELGSGLSTLTLTLALTLSLTQIHLYIHHVVTCRRPSWIFENLNCLLLNVQDLQCSSKYCSHTHVCWRTPARVVMTYTALYTYTACTALSYLVHPCTVLIHLCRSVWSI
jgi:hypothetical protein